jgi:hypothetical protein
MIMPCLFTNLVSADTEKFSVEINFTGNYLNSLGQIVFILALTKMITLILTPTNFTSFLKTDNLAETK